MFGKFKVPFTISEKDLKITTDQTKRGFLYKRTQGAETIEKFVSTRGNEVIINPIEPVNKPRCISPHFQIELAQPVTVEPKTKTKIFLKFPVEIGIFVSKRGKFEGIDIVTFAPQKFTLYGNAKTGVICRYYKSDVYLSFPGSDGIAEGVMRVNIENDGEEWCNITKLVFNAYNVHLFYTDEIVSLDASVKVLGPMRAETSFYNRPVEKGSTASIELYESRKIVALMPHFYMEEGL